MDNIEITSLPSILFSHIYQAENYRNSFPVRENFLEIFYIAEGMIELEVGKEKHFVKKGDVVCLFHNEKTSIFANAFHSHHTVGISAEWKFSSDDQELLLPVVTPEKNNTSSICLLIDDFVHNQLAYKASKTLGATKALELLCEIDKCNRKAQNKGHPGELRYTEKAKDYIHKNIHTSLTQEAIAQHLGISPEYLCSVFRKTEGTTIMRYINKLKLENIKALMDNANMHLYEVAAMYGYNDPNYVSRLYKQLFGYSISHKPKVHFEIE